MKVTRVNDEVKLDALLSVPRLGTSMVSPDGQWIAWTWSGAGVSADVYAAPVDGRMRPIQLTATKERTVVRSWTSDNRSVVVAQDHGGDERVQLLRVDLDAPGILQPLTEASPSFFLRGGQVHPNGRWLIYAANFDFESDQEIEAPWIYRHDLISGERQVLARPLKPSDTIPELNDQGTHILYTRGDLDPSGVQVWLVDIEGRQDREILNAGTAAKVTASWLPDGRRILFLAEAGTYRRLGLYDIETGHQSWLIDDPTRSVETAFAPRGHAEDTIVAIEVQDARSCASLLDLSSANEQPISALTGNLIPLAAATADVWVAEYSGARNPADLVRVHATTSPTEFGATSLTRIHEFSRIGPNDLIPAEDMRWKSTDGLTIQGWLYRPTGTARGTVVLVHGGPTAHSEDEFDVKIQYLAAQGFIVLAPNYRGSTGFSLDFEQAVKEDGWGGREQDDIRTGIEALIDRGIAEPGKIGITGTSYGGYSSWWAITQWPTAIVAAAAPICGMTDLVVDYYTTRPDLRPYSEEMMGGSPEEAPERYRERSPINFVQQIRGRLLIVQGMRDPNVTPENMEVVCEALDREGVKYQLLTFEDEGHGIKKQRNLRTLCLNLSDFFAQAFEHADSANAR
jgi:dipeptidyl aminopeptidase/acylaminoacyl peptidase